MPYLVFGIIIILTVLNQTTICKFFNYNLTKPLAFLGTYSLYLYLCHWNVLMGMRYAAPDIKTIPGFGIYIAICIRYSLLLMLLDKKRKGWKGIIIINSILLIVAVLTAVFQTP